MVSTDQTSVLLDHIRLHASDYYPSLAPGRFGVQLLSKQERASAVLYRFRVNNERQAHSVYVKVPHRFSVKRHKNGDVSGKPQLFPKTEPGDMHWLYYTALGTIYNYYMGINSEQLGAIRVLDYLPQYHAILTEESNDPKLRDLFFRENRLRFPWGHRSHAGISDAFQNVGTWLRLYHLMPKKDDVKIRHQHRDDYVGAVTIIIDYLARRLNYGSFFSETMSVLSQMAREILPESLPLGLGHGDFAMRNILVGRNSRVTVLDTFAKWRTSIYEDIGYFLNDFKMSSPQVVSHGLAFSSYQLATYEQVFLKAYFDQNSPPYPAVRLYEILALLDKWSSKFARWSQQPRYIRVVNDINIRSISHYYRLRLAALLAEVARS